MASSNPSPRLPVNVVESRCPWAVIALILYTTEFRKTPYTQHYTSATTKSRYKQAQLRSVCSALRFTFVFSVDDPGTIITSIATFCPTSEIPAFTASHGSFLYSSFACSAPAFETVGSSYQYFDIQFCFICSAVQPSSNSTQSASAKQRCSDRR